MTIWTFTPIPGDEPPPATLRMQAQRHADNTGELVRIETRQGLVFHTYAPEV